MHLTSYLLDLARYADQFYSLYHGLEGRDVLYKNPGTSLRSYVVVNINHEYLKLSPTMEIIYQECKSFAYDKDVISGVNRMMAEKPYYVAEKILEAGGACKHLNTCISRLNSLNRDRDEQFMRLQIEDYDFTGPTPRAHRHTLYLIKDTMAELEQLLDESQGDKSA